MERFKKIINSRAGFAAVTNLFTVLVSLFLFRPFFEESDDVNIALIAEGAYGRNEPHLIYSNYIYGKILCFLQSLLPGIRWHFVVMMFITFIALTVFVYILAKDKKGRILSVVFLLACFYEVYVSVQFSKVATVIAICSYFMLFELVRSDMTSQKRTIITTAAMLCLFFSVILRVDSFLLATLVAGCYGICQVIKDCKKGEFVKKLRKYLLYFVPVFIILIICVYADRTAYRDREWSDFMRYYASIQEMVDYHNSALLYDRHGDELAEMGVSKNDALMFITYEMLDSDPSIVDLMDNISALEPKGISYVNVYLLKAWVANIYNELFRPSGVIFGILFLSGITITLPQSFAKRFYMINMIVQAVITFCVLFWYQYSGRWCHRIVYALLLAEFVFLVYLLFTSDAFVYDRPLITCIFLFLAVSAVYIRLGNEFDYQEYKRSEFDHDELIEFMQDRKDCLFVTDVFTMVGYGKYNIFTASKKGQFENCLQPDSVLTANTPINTSIAKKYGYLDPFDALSSRDPKVILVDAINPDVELTYCNEHGDGKIYGLSSAGTAGNIPLYNIL